MWGCGGTFRSLEEGNRRAFYCPEAGGRLVCECILKLYDFHRWRLIQHVIAETLWNVLWAFSWICVRLFEALLRV